MKQTIEIEVPDGKKAVWRDDRIVFEDIKPKLPKTWEEFCNQYTIKESEVYIDANSIIKWANRNYRIPNIDRNFLPNEKSARQHFALMQLHQLRDCYRQGWKPDWNDRTNKYCIESYVEPISKNKKWCIITHTTYNRFLSFQEEDIAKEFLNNFQDLIEQADDLI